MSTCLFESEQLQCAPTVHRGDYITWRHPRLGVCVGYVAGVYETGITARREHIDRFTKPHYIEHGRYHKTIAQ